MIFIKFIFGWLVYVGIGTVVVVLLNIANSTILNYIVIGIVIVLSIMGIRGTHVSDSDKGMRHDGFDPDEGGDGM